MAVAILLGACGSNQDANRASPSDSGRPTATATPTPTATSLRLLYRAWDGDKYFLVAANADGSNSVVLSGANFANPDLIRFVQSRSRRWTRAPRPALLPCVS